MNARRRNHRLDLDKFFHNLVIYINYGDDQLWGLDVTVGQILCFFAFDMRHHPISTVLS